MRGERDPARWGGKGGLCNGGVVGGAVMDGGTGSGVGETWGG